MQMALTSVLATLEDERVEIVRGLRRRDGDVLDWLIERYQHRLFRCGKALADEHTFCHYCGASAKAHA